MCDKIDTPWSLTTIHFSRLLLITIGLFKSLQLS